MRTWTFEEPIYGHKFLLLHGTRQQYAAFLKRKFKDDYEVPDDCDGLVRSVPTGVAIWFPERIRRTNYWIGVVAHEALHATAAALISRDIRLEENNMHEPYAYYLQWIVEECCNRLFGGRS